MASLIVLWTSILQQLFWYLLNILSYVINSYCSWIKSCFPYSTCNVFDYVIWFTWVSNDIILQNIQTCLVFVETLLGIIDLTASWFGLRQSILEIGLIHSLVLTWHSWPVPRSRYWISFRFSCFPSFSAFLVFGVLHSCINYNLG